MRARGLKDTTRYPGSLLIAGVAGNLLTIALMLPRSVESADWIPKCEPNDDGVYCTETVQAFLGFIGLGEEKGELERAVEPPSAPCPNQPILPRLPSDFEKNGADCSHFIADDAGDLPPMGGTRSRATRAILGLDDRRTRVD